MAMSEGASTVHGRRGDAAEDVAEAVLVAGQRDGAGGAGRKAVLLLRLPEKLQERRVAQVRQPHHEPSAVRADRHVPRRHRRGPGIPSAPPPHSAAQPGDRRDRDHVAHAVLLGSDGRIRAFSLLAAALRSGWELGNLVASCGMLGGVEELDLAPAPPRLPRRRQALCHPRSPPLIGPGAAPASRAAGAHCIPRCCRPMPPEPLCWCRRASGSTSEAILSGQHRASVDNDLTFPVAEPELF
jgi:hypothetical protein